MKKLGILLVTFIMVSTLAIAQPGGGRMNPEERAKRQTEELTEKLDLSKDQAKKVEAINLKYAKKMGDMFRDMRDSGNMDREAMREKMGALREEQNKEMQKVLDKDQMKEYEAYLKEQDERRAQRRGPGGSR